MALATDVKNIQKRIQDKKIKKIIYIQDKIINIIVA
jgi:leucyl-tRNA synthetase